MARSASTQICPLLTATPRGTRLLWVLWAASAAAGALGLLVRRGRRPCTACQSAPKPRQHVARCGRQRVGAAAASRAIEPVDDPDACRAREAAARRMRRRLGSHNGSCVRCQTRVSGRHVIGRVAAGSEAGFWHCPHRGCTKGRFGGPADLPRRKVEFLLCSLRARRPWVSTVAPVQQVCTDHLSTAGHATTRE